MRNPVGAARHVPSLLSGRTVTKNGHRRLPVRKWLDVATLVVAVAIASDACHGADR